jgi:hypothetical protein
MSVTSSQVARKTGGGAAAMRGRGVAAHGNSALARRKRACNRQYMREWRADPKNRKRERERAAASGKARQLEDALADIRSGTKHIDKPLCAMCRHKPPVMMVDRLRATVKGFVRVELPYCGEC